MYLYSEQLMQDFLPLYILTCPCIELLEQRPAGLRLVCHGLLDVVPPIKPLKNANIILGSYQFCGGPK
jgi:hypothetical protein